MSIEKLIPVAVALAMITIARGQLPTALKGLRIAQYTILRESQSLKWGKPFIIKDRK
jgi:hypothetical protein